MSFLHPAIAWAGVAAVALPIIIHLLFRRRRVSIEWAAMELLREAVRRTNRRLQFEHWIVLTLRCLMLLAAGLAIAVPIFGTSVGGGQARRLVMVVIDNGASSALRGGSESELVRVIDEVRTMLAQSEIRDRVGIVLASQSPTLVLAPTVDTAAIEQALSRIEPAQTPSELKDAFMLALATINAARLDGSASGEVARVVLASAFRRASLTDVSSISGANTANTVGAVQAKSDASAGTDAASTTPRIEIIALLPAQDSPSDARVVHVDARPAPAGAAVLVRAVIAREGASLEAGQTFVRATGTGMSAAPERAVLWEKGQSEATIDFQLLPAAQVAGTRKIGVEVHIEDDNLSTGNAGFAAVDVRSELEIGVVGRRTSLDASELERVPSSLWISRALSPSVGSGMRVRDIDPSACDGRALLGLDAVVLARPDLLSPSACDAIGKFALSGGVVVVIPAGESIAQTWGQVVFSKLSVPLRVAAEAVDHDPPLRLAEEQPPSSLLSSIAPELSALVAPIETKRTVALSGFSKGEVVLVNADGSPLVVAQAPRRDDGRVERGMVIGFSTAPELIWTNLPVKPLMVPLLQEIVRAGIQMAAGRNEVAVGERMSGEALAIMRHEATIQPRATEGNTTTTLAIGQDGVSTNLVERAGIWRSDAGAMVASNVRPASIALAPNAPDSVRAALAPLGDVRFRSSESNETTAQVPSEADWSFMLLVIALALLLIEGVLSRLFSHASLPSASSTDETVSIVGRVRVRARSEPAMSSSSSISSSGGRT